MKFPKKEKPVQKETSKLEKLKEKAITCTPYVIALFSLPLCFLLGSAAATTGSYVVMGLSVVFGTFIPYVFYTATKYILWG